MQPLTLAILLLLQAPPGAEFFQEEPIDHLNTSTGSLNGDDYASRGRISSCGFGCVDWPALDEGMDWTRPAGAACAEDLPFCAMQFDRLVASFRRVVHAWPHTREINSPLTCVSW